MIAVKRTSTTALLGLALTLVGLSFAPAVTAADPADPSDVAMVFDLSASILRDKPTRERFATALDQIADRVLTKDDDLVKGDATVSMLRFASKAEMYPGCSDLKLKDSPDNVLKFADCLRSVADDYRKGVRKSRTNRIGTDTNYVAAMEQAAGHLPNGAKRPAVIFFTDGKHDVPGVPNREVLRARDRLFMDRSPFALLPVGMGLDAKTRPALERGLEELQTIKDMGPCPGGQEFSWPSVVFDSPADAGRAVAEALQQATCTFTVTDLPPPAPPGVPTNVTVLPGDSGIEIRWTAPDQPGSDPINDYEAQCQTAGAADWIVSAEGVSVATAAEVAPLVNGETYQCEVRALSEAGPSPWALASSTVAPYGAPLAPEKPSVAAGNGQADVSVAAATTVPVNAFHFECSSDGGATWTNRTDANPSDPISTITGLTNGQEYVCRAFGENERGLSDASPASDVFRPCGSLFQCNPTLPYILAAIIGTILALLLYALWAWWRGRTRSYVSARVDEFPAENLGRGPAVGLSYVRSGEGGEIQQVVRDAGTNADVRIRYLGGDQFEIAGASGPVRTKSGMPVEIPDSGGEIHTINLRAMSEPIRQSPNAAGPEDWSGASASLSGTADTNQDEGWD